MPTACPISHAGTERPSLQQDAARAHGQDVTEELRLQKALEKAKVELGKARGEEHSRSSAKIQDLVGQLAEAQAKSVRAKSLAEMTKAGYVYIISNIGSFGDRVFKIGMTRRLEPMDRVRELGGASVPFPFDVHAMVYSDDAPGLEAAFHQRFRERSLNLINQRKEFFKVDVGELERFASERGLAMTFTKLAEAREYRESAAMRLAKGSGPTAVRGTPVDQLALASTLLHAPESIGRRVARGFSGCANRGPLTACEPLALQAVTSLSIGQAECVTAAQLCGGGRAPWTPRPRNSAHEPSTSRGRLPLLIVSDLSAITSTTGGVCSCGC